MEDKKQPDQITPMETPVKKIPQDISPSKDPDLSPDEDNPINPNETPPQA